MTIDETKYMLLPRKEQRQLFINELHEGHTGYINFPHIEAGDEYPWKNSHFVLLGRDDPENEIKEYYDTYVTINRFRTKSRKGEFCSELTGIFIDLDVMHNVKPYDANQADTIISAALERLDQECSEGKILAPTVMTLSGRGIGCLYLYPDSVSATDPEAASFHETLYNKMIGRFRVLYPEPVIDVDQRITDKARVCRLPGTYNNKAGRYAVLYRLNPENRYTQTEMYEGMRLGDITDEPEKKTKKAPAVKKKNKSDSDPKVKDQKNSSQAHDCKETEIHVPKISRFGQCVAKSRLAMMDKLLTMREFREGDGREELVFITYCHLKQLYPPEEAHEKIVEFNQKLEEPLGKTELTACIRNVDSHSSVYRESLNGTYIFKNQTIIELLSLTDTEIQELGIKKTQETSVKRNEAREKTGERDRKICALFLEGYSHTDIIKMLPEGLSCSLRTAKRVTQRYGLGSGREASVEDLTFDGANYYKRSSVDINQKVVPTLPILYEKNCEVFLEDSGAKTTPFDEAVSKELDELANRMLLNGTNTWVTGTGGTGKSTLLKKYRDGAVKAGKKVLVTSSTNLTAKKMHGLTVHKAFGLDIRWYNAAEEPDPKTVLKILQYDIVIIDEVGMVRRDLFDYCMRCIRAAETIRDQPIQVVVCGDYGQLSPGVSKKELPKIDCPPGELYAFQSDKWKEMGFHSGLIRLVKPVRQLKDPKYAHSINRLRIRDRSTKSYFNTRVNAEYLYSEDATHLCAYVKVVDAVNRTCIARHKDDPSYKEFQLQRTDNGANPDEADTVPVYIGMPVITSANIKNCCKGEMGKIIRVGKKSVTISTMEGETIRVPIKLVKTYSDGDILYMPTIQPAYAITIHKAQGLTLPRVIVHPRCFAAGQLYTALSRVACLEDLILTEPILDNDIICNLKAAKYGMEDEDME